MTTLERYLHSFLELSEDTLKALIPLFKKYRYKKGDYYALEGERANKIAFLERGFVRAFYRNEEGEEFNKLFFQQPAIVGAYSSLITGEKNIINIQCLSECEMYEANFQQILALYPKYREVESLNRMMAEDFFVKKEKREMSLVMHNATRRYHDFREEFPAFESNIAQYHIASYLGITPIQLSRIRAKKRS